MIFAIVFIITFVIGFALGLAMPFILIRFPFFNIKSEIKKSNENDEQNEDIKPSNFSKDILDEWVNGIAGGE